MTDVPRPVWPRLVLLLFALVPMAFFAAVAMWSGTDADKLDRDGVVTDARVTEVIHDRHGSRVTVRFDLPGGATVTALCRSCDYKLDVGETVKVRCNPDDPAANVELAGREFHRNISILAWGTAGLIAALAGGRAGWLLARRARRLHRC